MPREYTLAAESAKLALLKYNSAGEHSLYPLLIAYFAYLESSEKLNAMPLLMRCPIVAIKIGRNLLLLILPEKWILLK